MTAARNSLTDTFITALPDWQREVCTKLRQLIHEAVPGVEEVIKRGDRPYFVFHGNICALQATKDHINLFIYDPIAPDPDHIINQGEGNKTARSVQIHPKDTPNEKAIKNLLAAVASNNLAGGWRKLS